MRKKILKFDINKHEFLTDSHLEILKYIHNYIHSIEGSIRHGHYFKKTFIQIDEGNVLISFNTKNKIVKHIKLNIENDCTVEEDNFITYIVIFPKYDDVLQYEMMSFKEIKDVIYPKDFEKLIYYFFDFLYDRNLKRIISINI